MQFTRRTIGTGLAVLAVSTTTACGTSGAGTTADASSASITSAAGDSLAAAPSTDMDVATEEPVPLAPGDTISVTVAYADWEDAAAAVEVGALVPGLVESGGTCTLT